MTIDLDRSQTVCLIIVLVMSDVRKNSLASPSFDTVSTQENQRRYRKLMLTDSKTPQHPLCQEPLLICFMFKYPTPSANLSSAEHIILCNMKVQIRQPCYKLMCF